MIANGPIRAALQQKYGKDFDVFEKITRALNEKRMADAMKLGPSLSKEQMASLKIFKCEYAPIFENEIREKFEKEGKEKQNQLQQQRLELERQAQDLRQQAQALAVQRDRMLEQDGKAIGNVLRRVKVGAK
jgi:hypothetical protein